MPLPLALISLAHLGMIILMVLGFGFVIFWHELGHFLAAKWVGIKVEQFAVGFGHALFSWRKGIGFRLGNSQKEYRERAEKHLMSRETGSRQVDEKVEFSDAQISAAADELGLGETEYRLNYIPLGGYVKMLGQDDLKADAVAEDPRAYNKKSISARMLVISAGVIMNIILAAIGFMVLFLIGFHVQPAWAGNILPGSPADKAGLKIGDRIIYFDGKSQDDATKITLNTALTKDGTPIPIVIDRPLDAEGLQFERKTLRITPARSRDEGFLQIGVSFPVRLEGPKKDGEVQIDRTKLLAHITSDALLIQPGDVITAVNGIPVKREADQVSYQNYVLFDKILQASQGKPISLTIVDADGKAREGHPTFQPHFEDPFAGPLNIAGMLPRTVVFQITDKSPVEGKILPDDVIESMSDADPLPHPSREQLVTRLGKDGETAATLRLDVLRDGKHIAVDNLKPTMSVGNGRKGLGLGLTADEGHNAVAAVMNDSPAEKAGIKGGDEVTAMNGIPVANWYDMQRIIAQLDGKGGPAQVKVSIKRAGVEIAPVTMTLDASQLAAVKDMRYSASYLSLAEYNIIRKTSSPITAAKWGVTETRDFILQFYLTLHRMVDRSVSPSNMMGPVGIFMAGGHFAEKGIDWLLWFLAMISANLAVVNFLPIPVVDGGQFMFLIMEKIKGKPLSPRTLAFAQYVGLAFLAGVVLFVTYHDIFRLY